MSLQFKSKELYKYLMFLDKKLTVSLKKTAEITIISTNNGLDCLFSSETFAVLHTIPTIAIEDGQITLDFDDLVSATSGADEVELKEVDGNLAMVNKFPIFKLMYKSGTINKVGENVVKLTKKDTNKFIKELSSYRSQLKKSIFDESSWIYVLFSDGYIQFRTINPLEYKKSSVEIDGFQPRLEMFFDKSMIKIMDVFFKGNELKISDEILENSQYRVLFNHIQLNKMLYFPDKYMV